MIKTYPINNELAGLVAMASEAEQIALTQEIAKEGKLVLPIVLWKGEIVDGRCRQVACTQLNIEMTTTELDKNLSFDEVAGTVKALNTRRNLTMTQKVMSALRQTLSRRSKEKVVDIAKSWGIGDKILKNARFIAKQRPEFIEPLFQGRVIMITNKDGIEVSTNKITAIYAYLRRVEEDVKQNDEYVWEEDTFIRTQAGKEWYYEQIQIAEQVGDVKFKMLVAELANYKFEVKDISDET